MPLKTWTHCRICGSSHLKPIIDLGDQPLSGVFPRPNVPDPTIAPLQLVRCTECSLVQLLHTPELTEMYGATYGYYSSISPTMVSHLEAKVHELVRIAKPKAGDIVLDIGCNDGTLLNTYGAKAGLTRIGMDPSSKKFAKNFQPDIRVVYDFFNEKGARTLSAGINELLRSGRAWAHLVDERGARAPDDQCPTGGESQTFRLGFIVNDKNFSGRRSLYEARQYCDAGGKLSHT